MPLTHSSYINASKPSHFIWMNRFRDEQRHLYRLALSIDQYMCYNISSDIYEVHHFLLEVNKTLYEHGDAISMFVSFSVKTKCLYMLDLLQNQKQNWIACFQRDSCICHLFDIWYFKKYFFTFLFSYFNAWIKQFNKIKFQFTVNQHTAQPV